MVVVQGLRIIEVINLPYVLDSVSTHLQDRHVYCHVICSPEVVTLQVSQVTILHQVQQFSVEHPQMGYHKHNIPKTGLFDDNLRVWPWVPYFVIEGEEVGVGDPALRLRECGVEQFEDLFT